MSNSKRGNGSLLLLTGAIAGAAATYYLNTPKGKQMIADVKNRSNQLGTDISNKAQNWKDQAVNTAQNWKETATNKYQDVKEQIASKATDVADTAEAKVGSFESGVNSAKQKMQAEKSLA